MTRHTDRVRIDSDGTPILRCLVQECRREWAGDRDCPLCQARRLALDWGGDEIERLAPRWPDREDY